MTTDDVLFWEGNLRSYLDNRKQLISAEVENTSEDHVLQTEEQAWAAALGDRFAVRLPELGEIWMSEPQEVEVDVSYDHLSRAIFDPEVPTYIPGYRVVLHAPLEGDANVLKLQASAFTYNPPRGSLRNGEVTRTIEYPHDKPLDFDAEAKRFHDGLSGHLAFAARDISGHRDELEKHALSSIRFRRERIEKHKAQLAETSIPIGPPGERKKKDIVEAVIRKPSPAQQLAPSEPIKLEPSIQDSVFEHILTVIRDTGVGMEKTPATYLPMAEEERRNVFLTNLNTHYRGRTSAEAFNVKGKTDLLISYEEKNLFIGECKIWSGPKDFASAIDQLFGYAAWRDTRLALVVFVGQKNLSQVIAKAREALEQHSQFERWVEGQNETELRAEMSWPGDPDRRIALACNFFHLPS